MIKPMLATLTDKPFDDPRWVFEVKWDGYRIIATLKRGEVTLWSRNGVNVTKKYEPVTKALADTAANAVLDGELVALTAKGVPNFQLLQHYDESRRPLAYYVFDLLFLEGEDLRDLPLSDRKEKLKEMLKTNRMVRYSEHVIEHGIRYFKIVVKQGLEGVMAKESSSRYYSGARTRDWLKIKAEKRQEAIIVGYTKPKGSRKYIGSLLMAVYDKNKLVYVGRAGGIGGRDLKTLHTTLFPLRGPKSLSEKISNESEVTWVKPKLVGEVRFTEWTSDGRMRHPIFLGLRREKKPREVTHEHEIHQP